MTTNDISPPDFVMWRPISSHDDLGWQRQWFGNELDPKARFNVRGLGIREPMFNVNVSRPIGTGDWLIMFFHEPARLEESNSNPSVKENTLILWPPGAKQFYSWGAAANKEPHSWMHVEGTWVNQQVKQNRLPVSQPVTIAQPLMLVPLDQLMQEMTKQEKPDGIILENLFQNWARSIARYLRTVNLDSCIPDALIAVREFLDQNFTTNTPLDELARIANMSRSHLCHEFRKYFGTTISAYLIRRRMSIAQRMLFDMSLRPGEIAIQVGYPDIYQFSKQFKKSFGMSPTAYRKQHSPK